ncbi:MAG: metalloregulator ArsR/SmtB family transcription factor [Candidatus Micrarchaeia archaeon]
MKSRFVCQIRSVNREAVRRANSAIPCDEVILTVSGAFSAMADPTRVKILIALSARELCVCEIASILSLSQSAVSHQLRVLRDLRFVRFRKEGKMVYYRLADGHVKELLKAGVKHAKE